MGGISKNCFVIKTPRDPISSTVLVSLSLFFSIIFFLTAPYSALYGIIFGWGGTYTAAHQTPHRLNLSVSEGEAGHLIALAGAKKKKKKRLKRA